MFFSSDIENGFLIDVASLGNAGGVGRVLLVIEAVLVRGRRRDPRPPGLLLPPVLEDGLDDLEPLADDLRLLPRPLRPAPHPGQLRQLAHQPPDQVQLNITLDQQSTLDLRIRLEHYLVQNIQSEKYIDIFYYSTVTNICIYWHWADLGSSAGLGPGVWSPHGCVTCHVSLCLTPPLYTLYSIQDTGGAPQLHRGSTLHLSAFHQSEASAGAAGGTGETQAAAFNRRLGRRLEAGQINVGQNCRLHCIHTYIITLCLYVHR